MSDQYLGIAIFSRSHTLNTNSNVIFFKIRDSGLFQIFFNPENFEIVTNPDSFLKLDSGDLEKLNSELKLNLPDIELKLFSVDEIHAKIEPSSTRIQNLFLYQGNQKIKCLKIGPDDFPEITDNFEIFIYLEENKLEDLKDQTVEYESCVYLFKNKNIYSHIASSYYHYGMIVCLYLYATSDFKFYYYQTKIINLINYFICSQDDLDDFNGYLFYYDPNLVFNVVHTNRIYVAFQYRKFLDGFLEGLNWLGIPKSNYKKYVLDLTLNHKPIDF